MSNKVIIRAAEPGRSTFRQLVWKKIKIRKSLDEICHYMELTLPVSERNKIHKHYRVEVLCHNPLITSHDSTAWVTVVMVDEVTAISDASQKNLQVIGRSPARDIIDSSWGGSITNQENLEMVANVIAGRFGITVALLPGIPETGPVFAFSWENESPWMKLIQEADKQGYIFTSNQIGHLYLWKPPTHVRSEGFFIAEGKNTRELQYTQNGAEQFYEYIVQAGFREAREIDDTCRNNRIMTMALTDLFIQQEGLDRRALTEMLRRKHNRIKATVTGWGLSDAQIRALGSTNQRELFWAPNFLIPVKAPSFGLDANLLVCQVELTANPSVMTSDITLVNKEAYS